MKIIVVTTCEPQPPEEVKRLREQIADQIPGYPIIILPPGCVSVDLVETDNEPLDWKMN